MIQNNQVWRDSMTHPSFQWACLVHGDPGRTMRGSNAMKQCVAKLEPQHQDAVTMDSCVCSCSWNGCFIFKSENAVYITDEALSEQVKLKKFHTNDLRNLTLLRNKLHYTNIDIYFSQQSLRNCSRLNSVLNSPYEEN